MHRIIAAAFVLLPMHALAQSYPNPTLAPATDLTTPHTAAARAGDVFNIVDFGARCDGKTNDNDAINATFAAAASSVAYTTNNMVTITGPSGGDQRGCLMNSINATIFRRGTGANPRARVTVRDMTLLCSGAGSVCFDAIGSSLIKMSNVNIRGGDGVHTPEICIQVGIIKDTESAAWHSFSHVNCNNNFTLAALYNVGSEANLYIDCIFGNSHSASGPIGMLGAITGGHQYVNGTFSNVLLTGGAGHGAMATVIVSAGAVSSVTITYQGRNYAVGDVLSATSLAGGSGFSVPIATAAPMAAIIDGQNYWRASSAFISVQTAQNHWNSLTLVSFIGGSVRRYADGPAFWIAWGSGLTLVNSYVLTGGPHCFTLFDNGVIFGTVNTNLGFNINVSCEGNPAILRSMFLLSGANATPSLYNFRVHGSHGSPLSAFETSPNITSAKMQNVDLDIIYSPTTANMFASAKLWTVTGRVTVPNVAYWNAPASFQGQLFARDLVTPPDIGPLDILGGAAQATSCARQLSRTYVGPLCQVVRASDKAALDLYADILGNLDRPSARTFCYATTCKVSVQYDQSGNANNFVQMVDASRPTLEMALPALGNRAALMFGGLSAVAMAAPASDSLNDLFATGGYVSTVINTIAAASNANRLLFKTNDRTFGWDLRSAFNGTGYAFQQIAGTRGMWTTNIHSFGPRVLDVLYSTASTTNIPSLGIDGSAANTAATQPVGTVLTDAALPLILGNSAVTKGNRGFPGYIAETILWKVVPSALQFEAVRRNQAAYYSVANVN